MDNLRTLIKYEIANKALGYEIDPDAITDFVLAMMRKWHFDLVYGQKECSLWFPSKPCMESLHNICDGYLTERPRKEANRCSCECHFI